MLPLENSNTMNPTSSSDQNFHLGIGTLAQKNLSQPPETDPPASVKVASDLFELIGIIRAYSVLIFFMVNAATLYN